jgi:sugar lactone lactonase YvrE
MRGIDMKRKIQITAVSLLAVATLLFPANGRAKQPVWISQLAFPAPQTVSNPAFLALDRERQRYYVVDTQKKRLLSFDNAGTLLGEFDVAGGLTLPTAMTFARPGKMWLVERSTNALLYVDLKTQEIRTFSPRSTDGKPLVPDHITTDSSHRLYVSDRLSGRVYALDDNLKVAAAFAPQAGGQFVDFKIKGDTLWALERVKQEVYQFDLNGQQKQHIILQRKLDTPVSLEINPQRQIFILDRAIGRILRFAKSGKYLDSFGQKGYRRGQFNYPSQLIFDWQQRLCIVNQGNDRIEIFSH